MNQVQLNVDTKVTQVVIGLIRAIGRERALGLGTYTKSSGVDAQITSILTLLQKIEDKYLFTSQQVVVEDTRISTATFFSEETASPLTEENSSHVDNIEGHPKFDTFIHDHSGHVDYMFDEMSNGVFTKEVEETSFASSFVADLDHIQPPKEFDRCFHSYGPMVLTEVQPDTHIKMLDEEASDPKHTEVQLFDEGSPKDMSKKIEFETFDDKSLAEFFVEPETIAEFFVEPETIEDLYLDNFFLEIEESIPRSNMPSDEMLPSVELLVKEDGNLLMNSVLTTVCITFKFKALVGTVNTKLPLGSTGTFGFIDYANSMTLVWDPGLQRCMHSSVLLFVLALAAVTFLYFSSRDIFPKWAVSYKMGVPACYATGHDLEFQYILNGYSADKFISLIMQAILDSGDKIGCPPTFSLYEFAALQTCENDHWSLIVIESELELVKVASIVAAYVVHKAMLNECKNIFILVSCGKIKTTTRPMRYLAHFRGHRRIKERIMV
ncbi:hypothetical protein KY284_015144 [Solanum tuberosum]|nr:hypothetical protein KY284_015144 [Solanum tuberosum]